MDPSFSLFLVVAVVVYGWWRWRHRDDPSADLAPYPQGLRQVDMVRVQCQHPQHHPGQVPAHRVHARNAGLDVQEMRYNGWGSDSRSTLCRFHNVAGNELSVLHVECGRRCGTVETVALDDVDVAIGTLRYHGWCNDGDLLLCPVCSGSRSRSWR